MAITFHTIPNNYSPSDNPLSYVFSSNQTGQANFSYKVLTLLNGAVVSEDRVYPEASGRSQFDCSPIVTNLMQLPRVTTSLTTSMDTIYTVAIRVVEVYGAIPVEEAFGISSNIYTFKASLPSDEWEVKDFNTDYLDTKWLTDVPNNSFKIIRGQDVICSMLTSISQGLNVIFYDSSGLDLDTYNGANEFNRLWQLNVSSDNMDTIYTGLDFNDVTYFTVQIGTSELLTFVYVDDYCYGINELLWMNKYGSFDQFPIEHNVTSRSEIESNSFKKKYGAWVGNDYLYNSNSSGNTDFEKTITDKGTLVTNYMTESVQNWFVTAYESPKAYLYNTTGLQFSLSLKANSYKNKQGRFEDLIMEEMEYEKTMPRKSIKL